MNIALWVLQGLVALAFFATGAMKLFTPKAKLDANPHMGWAKDFSAGQVKLIGIAEVLGAVGLILPWATGILPALTPIAAGCSAAIMVGAAVVHARRKEPLIPPVVIGLLAVAIAVGRSGLL